MGPSVQELEEGPKLNQADSSLRLKAAACKRQPERVERPVEARA